MEIQRDLHLCFMDYEKAFDQVKHENLAEILRFIIVLYWNKIAAVRVSKW